jgi:hypothetical protein
LLVWNALPQMIGPHIEVGSAIGWALGLSTLLIALRHTRLIEERETRNSEHDLERLDYILESRSGADIDDDVETQSPDDPYLS